MRKKLNHYNPVPLTAEELDRNPRIKACVPEIKKVCPRACGSHEEVSVCSMNSHFSLSLHQVSHTSNHAKHSSNLVSRALSHAQNEV